MKEFYVAPEAEIIHFAPEENIAFDNQTSVVGWDVTDKQDGNWDNLDKWFNE